MGPWRLSIVPIFLLLSTGLAHADAITYQGTLGKYPIIAEITEASDGAIIGRYSYMGKGIDIPLQAEGAAGGNIVLGEELACTERTCDAYGDVRRPAPIGAIWRLTKSADGKAINGSWRASGKTESLPIALQQIGARPLDGPASTRALYEFSQDLGYGDHRLTASESSYEFAKLDVPLSVIGTEDFGRSRVQYVADPRVKMRFPQIEALAGGADAGPANAYLRDQRNRMNLAALNCAAMAYNGFGWLGYSPSGFGGYEDETIRVRYLSAQVLSWTQSGSLFCGGAHPYNHVNGYNLDVETGKILPLSRVLADYVPFAFGENAPAPVTAAQALADPNNYYFGPNARLVDYLNANRPPDIDTNLDLAPDDICPIAELITTNLAVRFVWPDRMTFFLSGLPHAIGACQTDILSISLARMGPFLAPDALNLFPELH